MSYYLGKVGRAGVRLVHSCRELYNDVNAAYLTGAVDVLVVRQRDGSLKSTPFHARFGKLGVLRTGDFKEVEVYLNGQEVELPMVIDESGKVFFAQPRPCQTSVSDDDLETGGLRDLTGIVTTASEQLGIRGDKEAVSEQLGTRGDKEAASEQLGTRGEREVGNKEEQLTEETSGDVRIDIEQLEKLSLEVVSPDSHVTETMSPDSHVTETMSPDSHVAETMSPDSHVTETTEDSTLSQDNAKPDKECSPPVLEGTLILSPRRGSDTELELEKEDTRRERLTRVETVGGVICDSALLQPSRSSPIPIIVPCGETPSHHAAFSSAPPDLEVLSDSALDDDRYLSSHVGPLPTALSDTEVEVKDRFSSKLWEWSAGSSRPLTTAEKERRRTISSEEQTLKDLTTAEGTHPGFWGALTGMLRRRHQRRVSVDGIYLDAIDNQSMDPEKLSQFFPQVSSPEGVAGGVVDVTGGSSGLGSSPAPSPTHSLNSHQYRHGDNLDKLVSTLEGVSLSLCGLNQGNIISEEAFQNSQVSFAAFNSNPELLMDPKLVVRVRGKYYPWQVAAPMIMSAIVFLQPLPEAAQSKLQQKYMPKKRQSFWNNFWGRRAVADKDDEPSLDNHKPVKSEGNTPNGTPQKWDREGVRGREGGGGRTGGRPDQAVLSSDDDEAPIPSVARPRQRSLKRRKCCLTNTPTSKQLASLPLKPGANEMVFSITTKFQGTTKAMCTVYLWDYHDKVVITDIDGTITRSDVAGQVLPLVGMDWTQNGVVELFHSVAGNGYKMLYLSARAIGQAGYTKDFLRKLSRSHKALPDGPLFLTPSSLVTAFKKEVIEKRPYEFKIECLQEVRSLFPADYCPLHAGFGNRNSDVRSYTQVGIPRSRIFTVNHKGHLKYEISSTFQSSYFHLMEFVDAQFPPVGGQTFSLCSPSPHPTSSPPSPPSPPPSPRHTKEEYSTFNYWRGHIPELTLNLDV